MNVLILAFPDYLAQAQRLAEHLNAPLAELALHHFPDGESLVRLPTGLPEHIVVCRSLNQPNDKLIELLFCAVTARQQGVKRISLVAPYLCYMRQDIANHPGEAVSQQILGHWLATLFDDVITIDPHLHRINTLDQAIPLKNAISLSAASEIAAFLKTQLSEGILLGPDSESRQWVARIAEATGFDYVVANKIRHSDTEIEITLPAADFSLKPVIIIDDVASTGHTLADAAQRLHSAGAHTIYAAITHPLFCGDAEAVLHAAGIRKIWSTDSIAHATACIHLDGLLASALTALPLYSPNAAEGTD